MEHNTLLTVTQAAERLSAEHGVHIPDWKVRRIADTLSVDIPRAGLYRLLSEDALSRIVDKLRSEGWIPEEAVPCK